MSIRFLTVQTKNKWKLHCQLPLNRRRVKITGHNKKNYKVQIDGHIDGEENDSMETDFTNSLIF